jgi:enoyl-CoA hydratase/carnithine racemase
MSFQGEQVLYDVSGRVATITLNRPDKLNAWTMQMERETTAAFHAAAGDEAVRAIVFTGAGRGFCAGADMSLLTALTGTDGKSPGADIVGRVELDPSVRDDFARRHAWLISIPKPVIAAINGPAVGLGFVLPLYCDFRLASEKAVFSTIFAKRGLVAEYGLAWILPRIVGMPTTIDWCFTARQVDAAEALRAGLVHRVLPEDGFLAAAQAFAAELANTVSPRSLARMKHQIYEAQFQGLGAAMDLSFQEMLASFKCEDFKEGVAHFLEKRAPVFTGK